MRFIIWCDSCGQREVTRRGGLCGRCEAPNDVAALIARGPTPMEPPRLLRFLRWLGGKA